ncbi:outer membrane beta-barrel family protein, partial [Flavobacterium psychrophilum]
IPSGVSDLDINIASNQLDLSMKFLFLNKNLQLNIIGNDIFRSNKSAYKSINNNIVQEYNNYYDIRSFRIALTYKFGNTKINIENRNLGNEEEKNRTK